MSGETKQQPANNSEIEYRWKRKGQKRKESPSITQSAPRFSVTDFRGLEKRISQQMSEGESPPKEKASGNDTEYQWKRLSSSASADDAPPQSKRQKKDTTPPFSVKHFQKVEKRISDRILPTEEISPSKPKFTVNDFEGLENRISKQLSATDLTAKMMEDEDFTEGDSVQDGGEKEVNVQESEEEEEESKEELEEEEEEEVYDGEYGQDSEDSEEEVIDDEYSVSGYEEKSDEEEDQFGLTEKEQKERPGSRLSRKLSRPASVRLDWAGNIMATDRNGEEH